MPLQILPLAKTPTHCELPECGRKLHQGDRLCCVRTDAGGLAWVCSRHAAPSVACRADRRVARLNQRQLARRFYPQPVRRLPAVRKPVAPRRSRLRVPRGAAWELLAASAVVAAYVAAMRLLTQIAGVGL